MKLSKQESEVLLDKIRQKYDEYAAKYNAKWFDRTLFEDRFSYALQNRMDISAFLLAEVTNFEKLKESYDKKKSRESFSDKIDKIIDEQLEQIRKYPRKNFHERSGIEISHMYGALYRLAEDLFPILWIVTEAADVRQKLQNMEARLYEFSNPSLQRLSPRTEDHALLLSRSQVSEMQIEKSKNNYLKEAAFFLHDLIVFLDYLVKLAEPAMEVPLNFSRSYQSAETKRKLSREFSNLTGFGAVFKVKHFAEDIVTDFRLSAFRA